MSDENGAVDSFQLEDDYEDDFLDFNNSSNANN